MQQAKAVFIIPSRGIDKNQADQHTILRSWAIKDFAPHTPQFVQLFRPENTINIKFAGIIKFSYCFSPIFFHFETHSLRILGLRRRIQVRVDGQQLSLPRHIDSDNTIATQVDDHVHNITFQFEEICWLNEILFN